MTSLDEAPEQRWRRTVDRRNRPAKLKVDRLLRDFGYAELDAEAGDAIEARLAGVALAVAPSLRNAVAGEVITIYANDSAAPLEGRARVEAVPVEPVKPAAVVEPAAVQPEAVAGPVAVEPAGAPEAGSVAPVASEQPGADVAGMVAYLKQQVIDARAEAERLRTELDGRIAAARIDVERDTESIIAEQAAVLEDQSRQIAELAAALNATRQALADTRDEIRRAVGELQALPGSTEPDGEPPPLREVGAAPGDPARDAVEGAQEEPDDEAGLSGEESADGREEAEAARMATPVSADEVPPGGEDEFAASVPSAADDDAAPALDEPAPDVRAADPEPAPDLAPPPDPPAASAVTRLRELDEPAAPAAPQPAEAAGAPQPAEAPPPVEPARAPQPAEAARAPDLDPPPPQPSEWLPADFRPQPAAAQPASAEPPAAEGEPESESDRNDRLTDFDDFLYDADELYDPGEPGEPGPAAVTGEPLESEIEARWPDEPTAALPPPPPPPPSPWAGDAGPAGPATAGRAKRTGVLRGRSGRARNRWDGSCSVCGRLPLENRRKDLEAAGWDLNGETPTCPQCRGVG